MKIVEFNIKKGIYNFELEEVNTQFHYHPAIEVLYSPEGVFSLETKTSFYENISFAIINANVVHRTSSESCRVNLLMFECDTFLCNRFLNEFNIELCEGIFVEKGKSGKMNFITVVSEFYTHNIIKRTNNKRVNECLDYFDAINPDYKTMIGDLKSKVNLSESRLSHIFKEEMGMSLKKYLVWSRLKKAFQYIVTNKISLYEASHKSGFYDQAHLSKAFKQMLGLNPSEVYNSRTVQG